MSLITGVLLDENGHYPVPGSKLDGEQKVYPTPISIETAYSATNLLIESAGDHLFSFVRLFKEKAHAMAPFTCIRAELEACALAAWLLDPQINGWERVRRSFAYRYNSINEERKFHNSMGDKNAAIVLQSRIDAVEGDALKLGYERLRDSKDRCKGIARAMPNITTLIQKTLGLEHLYRMTSGMAHGASWALIRLASRETEIKNMLEKHLDLEILLHLFQEGATAFMVPVWYKTILFGFEREPMIKMFRSVYKSLNVPVEYKKIWEIVT